MLEQTEWQVYLSGEIHSPWRKEIIEACRERQLPISFSYPKLDHEASDSVGEKILGPESHPFWKDHKSAKINALRTGHLLTDADLVIVKFGEKYKQWNAAFEAGQAAAQGIPIITLFPEVFTHALKEIHAQALAAANTTEQVIDILEYITTA